MTIVIIINRNVFGKKKEVKIYNESKTFALIACAHNEERVIAQLVDNLRRLNYNDALYDIYVVADNCSDKTAEVARKAGALVHERFSETGKGKGFALAWMFDRLFKLDKKYDAVCVFDADNLVHPNFLQEMNSRLCNGERIIQGYMDAKNPTDTWVSGVFAISFWIVNHVWSLAKYNMGLSCCLGGTGMCFDTEVLKRYGWRATCLTEDMEFTIQAMMEGIPTTWAHDAIIYDEKPLTFKQTWNQRKRWSQGHFDVADRYLIPMIKKAIKTRNIVMLDCSVNLIQPYFLTDAKGRVFIPAGFRKQLQAVSEERLVLRKDVFQDCLVLYPESVWFATQNQLRQRLNKWNAKHQQIFRQFVSDAEIMVPDGNGRILLPKRYLQMAGIQSDVRFIGVDNTIEIWAKEKAEQPFMNPEEFSEALQDILGESGMISD